MEQVFGDLQFQDQKAQGSAPLSSSQSWLPTRLAVKLPTSELLRINYNFFIL